MDYQQPGGFGYLLGCVLVFFFFGFRWSFLFLDTRQPIQASRFLMITGVCVQGYRGCFFGSGLSCKDRIEGFFFIGCTVLLFVLLLGK